VQTQSQYLREKLFERDKGICFFCKRDCHLIYLTACTATNSEARKVIIESLKDPLFLKKTSRCLNDLSLPFKPGMFWEAAHIIDVQDGGGASSLSNFRTLCVPCHHRETNTKRLFHKLKESVYLECTLQQVDSNKSLGSTIETQLLDNSFVASDLSKSGKRKATQTFSKTLIPKVVSRCKYKLNPSKLLKKKKSSTP